MIETKRKHFIVIAFVTIIAVYLLIVVGSSVRATGAGMGCPDWPTCFGQLIPPTDVSQLPINYQEIYKDRGYADVTFNAVKTWTEFFNRLVGVTIGFLSLWTLWAGWRIRQEHPASFYYSLLAFMLIGFNGWLGSVVVSSNLHPAMITTHMIASLLVVASLILAWRYAIPRETLTFSTGSNYRSLRLLLVIGLVITLIQIGLGVQVRENIDIIALDNAIARSDWVAHVGTALSSHVVFAMLVVLFNLFLAYRLFQAQLNQFTILLSKSIAVFVLLELMIGLLLANIGFPAALQPVHLLLVGLIFGVQTTLLVQLSLADKALKTEEAP